MKKKKRSIPTPCAPSPSNPIHSFQWSMVERDAAVFVDFNRKTCIRLRESSNRVAYIYLNMDIGLVLDVMNPTSFHNVYHLTTNTGGVKESIDKMVKFSQYIGAEDSVLRLLSQLVPITKETIDMAAKRKADREIKKTAVATTTTKTVGAKKVANTKKTGSVSAAARFQELIMRGTMTDDQIFKSVQAEFKLPDSKRGYVQWYRNYLKKNGKNPPAAKGVAA